MSNLALYEISGKHRKALDALTDPQAVLPQEAVHDTLEGIAGELQEKPVNVAKFMRNLETMAAARHQGWRKRKWLGGARRLKPAPGGSGIT